MGRAVIPGKRIDIDLANVPDMSVPTGDTSLSGNIVIRPQTTVRRRCLLSQQSEKRKKLVLGSCLLRRAIARAEGKQRPCPP
ncbi:hypothetical protein PFLUV_G00163020 [Perca fluviatilis]|uniref:Uncharacterized protein n=1 Tax=Perca fluviatilis TaxID=8168 RepID=A0A6A5ECR2_PERFL|nr:hypothetical protein PFLUV_G00163020 [Perca fluviatilis]